MSDALLFDLDRTLVDVQSFTDYGSARREAERLVDGFGDIAVPNTDWSADTVAAMSLLVACSGDPRWASVSAAIARHELAAVPGSAPMPGLHEAWARAAGLPRAVVTLVPEEVARAALAWHGVDCAGVVVIGRRADQRPKPSPDGLLAACRALGVTPQRAVMIGDSLWDLEAAAAAGIRFVGVPTRAGIMPPRAIVAPDLMAAVGLALENVTPGWSGLTRCSPSARPVT